MTLAMSEHIHHHPQSFHVMTQSQYSPPFDNAMGIEIDKSPPHLSHLSPPSSSSSCNSSIIYGQTTHMDFAGGEVQHFAPHQAPFQATQHSPSPHMNSQEQTMTLNPAQLRGSVGPSRVLTRRQARAAQQASQLGIDLHGDGLNPPPPPNYYSPEGYMLYPENNAQGSRPHTPSRLATDNNFQPQRSVSDLNINGNSLHAHAHMSPPYPSTPASTSSSNFSHYGFHPYATHSRSTSSSTHPRSNSPAMSVMSVATSMSSASSSRRLPLSAGASMASFPTTAKQKKRLVNRERKEICEYYASHPNARQEDIAARYGVERSTVSKILKHKDKWLNMPDGENNLIAKHRPSKFPEIEALLQTWLEECRGTKTLISDSMIRSKAKEVAKIMGIGDDKFKASSGWVENYKHRHGIRKGVWEGKKVLTEEDMFDDSLPQEDIVDELTAVKAATEHFVALREAGAAIEKAQQQQDLQQQMQHSQEAHSEQTVMDTTPPAASQGSPLQIQMEESKSHSVTPDQWPPPPPECMGIAPHETYHELPTSMTEHNGAPSIANQENDATAQHGHHAEVGKQSHVESAQDAAFQQHNHDVHMVQSHDSAGNNALAIQGIPHSQSASFMQYAHPAPSPVYPPADWNVGNSSDASAAAREATVAMERVLEYIKTQPRGFLTVHESNVMHTIKNVISTTANSP